MSTQSTVYDTDFYQWTQEQAALLREGKKRHWKYPLHL